MFVRDGKPIHMVECKGSENEILPSLKFLKREFPEVPASHVGLEGDREFFEGEGIKSCRAREFPTE